MVSMTATVHQLNMSCTVAAEKARRNSFLSAIWKESTLVQWTSVNRDSVILY